MVKHLFFILLASVILTSCVGSAESETQNKPTLHIIAGISAFQNKIEGNNSDSLNNIGEAHKFILHLLFETMQSGDMTSVIDTDTLKEIASFHLPSGITPTKRLRQKYFKNSLQAYFSYFRNLGNVEAVHGNLNIPEFCLFLRNRIEATKNSRIEVIMMGSPVHTDADPKFSFQDGWLSDAAFISDTPFRTDTERFNGVKFHLIYPQNSFVNDKHRKAIERFWSLYFSRQGGQLISFSCDSKSYERIGTQIEPRIYQFDQQDARILTRHSAIMKSEETAGVTDNHASENKVSGEVHEKTVRIGVSWDFPENTDIDLHVRFTDGQIVNHAKRTASNHVYHAGFVKDRIGSEGAKRSLNGYEEVQVVISNNCKPSDAIEKVMLNLYHSNRETEDATGEVTVTVLPDGKPELIPFQFKNSDRWIEIPGLLNVIAP